MDIKLRKPGHEIFVPDGTPLAGAISRTTRLAVAAHPDDIEIMAFHGILKCFESADECFFGIIATDGAGSPREGMYKNFTDDEMKVVRKKEQKKAAVVGEYGGVAFLNYTSSEIKNAGHPDPKDDLKDLLLLARPKFLYTHNPADKHDTHIGVTIAALQAMRELPRDQRPKQVIGCEVWRNLDWLPDALKVLMDVSGRDNLAAALNGIFDSQIAGGKRYDLATLGRRAANATFFDSHATDSATQLIFGLDLTPLVADESRDIIEYVCGFIDQFKADVRAKLGAKLGTL
jgi:LmbE family N-acetylglucosaminyl deacetylase